MSTAAVTYPIPISVMQISVQPRVEDEDPRPLDLPGRSVVVTILPAKNNNRLEVQQNQVSRIRRVAALALSSDDEDASQSPHPLSVACCFLIAMIPSGALIGLAQTCPQDSDLYKACFWGGIGLVPLIAFRFFRACITGT